MEATALSVGKSVLDGAIGYAKSAFAEEVALQLGVRRDQVFITNELEMIKAFLESAHGEGADDKVVKVWVKQVRDMAYDVEDCLQEFAVRLNKQSWWRIRRKMLDRRRVAKQMKELRANVEDVSQRNTRYSLIKGSGSKAATYTAAEQSSITSAALFGIDEARRAAKQEKSQVDLVQMINEEENNLRVIAVWGTSGGLGQTSIVRKAYENPDIESKFSCRAWVRLMHPFDPKDFVQSMVEQFNAAGGVNVLLRKKKTVQELTNKFEQYVNEKRYLIVINDLSTIEEWDWVKKCFPNNNMGSRIIVSTTQVEVASLCAGQGSVASELKQFSAGQNIYAFHDKGSQDATDLINEGSSSNTASTSTANKSTVPTCEISEENTVKKSLTRIRTMVAALEESHLVGREKEKSEIIKLVTGQASGQFEVITVWGMGGLGKTTLVKDIYQSQELNGIFDNRACVTVMRPFNLEELLRSLFMQLDRESSEKKDVVGLMSSTKNTLLLMSLAELIKELAKLFQTKRCLIVLDDVSSTAEWDRIVPIFHEMRKTIRIIVTTREESIAKHCCSQKQENIYKLKDLEYKDAHDLFTKKLFKGTVDMDKQYPELVQPTKLILKKCDQLPLAIVTIAGFLATQPKTPLEWRKLSEHLSAELEMNPQLGTIRTVLMRSYDGLPYHLKSCFLYMPIFPEDHRVGRGRLARRWSAEGYCREVRGKSAEEMADSYFMELIARSMILPPQESIRCTKGIDSCQVHDLMREIGISKSMEENLVFTLEQGCSTNSQVTMRHLAISSNWEGDQNEYESMVDVSRVRSLTVFGKWKSFFISDRMRLLRVLDLEDATGLLDHHLKHIGKFLHLRYLSLRGCGGIFHLPDSLGNLRQLETLDIRETNVVMLPKTIIKLQKLNYLRAGEVLLNVFVGYEVIVHLLPKVMRTRLCSLSLVSLACCLAWCAPQCMDDMIRHDVCTLFCCFLLPILAMRLDKHGVVLPRGMKKLKALHTLGVVNIGRQGKAVLNDIKGLIQLRKLGVTDIKKDNGQELCAAIVGLSRLESLSIRSEERPGLCGCLDGTFTFPENLQRLKLYGNLVKLPEWVQGLKNLVKLKLRSSSISEPDAAIQVLGILPNLAFLHLLRKSFVGEEVSLNFPPEMFPSLIVLELELRFNSVKFEQGATPKLELLKFCDVTISSDSLRGLSSLSCLKEVVLQGYFDGDDLKHVRAAVAENPNLPVVKMV